MADFSPNPYIPSSFKSGSPEAALKDLASGNLPVSTKSPIIKQDKNVVQSFEAPKVIIDKNVTPIAFKQKLIAKYPQGTASDGRKYADIPEVELIARIVRKYPDWVTSDWKKYSDFLPRPASPNDSLEYRLKQIEDLYKIPKSEFYTTWGVRWQTEKEKQFTTDVTNRQNENELVKTLKAPYRGLESVGQNLAYGTAWVSADVIDLFWGDKLADKIRTVTEQEQFKTGIGRTNKWLIGGIQEWSPSSIIEALSSGVGYMATGAKIPLFLTALSQWGNLSLEWEQQGQWDFWDKLTAYTTGGISSVIERVSGQNVINWLMKSGVQKKTATTFVDKMSNYLKTLKPSDLEAGTEIIQQKIENIGRDIMWVKYEEWLKQYFEAGLLGKVLGKVGDKWFSESPITTLPPAPPKSVNKNLDVIQTIKTGLTGNKVLKQAKSRWFDPELDIATYEDLKPTITNDGRVNTDVAQENLQNFIEPYQEQLDNAIAQEWEFVPADVFRREILKELESEKSNIRNYEWWVNTANNAVDTAVRNFGDSNGNIPLSEVNNIKKKLGSNNNYLDPNITLDKTIARAAKQIVEDYTKSADVKALNNDLARWYTTREYLQILGSGTKTVKWGRLGKWVARLAGVIIGSKLWPITGWVWWEVAAKLQSKMMQWALKGTKQAMPEMKSFGNIKKKQQLLLPPPSGITPSWNVVDVKPMTGYAPWVLQEKSWKIFNPQTSSNTTITPQSQSPLAQVLEWTRKTPVIPAKTKSKENLSWKKVNNSIIDGLKKKKETAKNSIVENLKKKKEVKANLPKTPQVEGKTVDPELLSLQKSQESLPWLPKVEVPADYVPKDWLPTWTEFEAPIISSISKTKWKLPSPDIKRPQIRGIDLGIRSNMIDSLKKEGIFTDSFFAISDKNLSNKFIEYAEQKAIKKWVPTTGKEVSMTRLLDTAKNSADTTLTPKEYVKLDWHKGIYLRFDIGDGNKVAVNSSYTDIFFKNFDDVTFKGSNEVSPVVVYSKWKDVGIIMPIYDPYASKEVLWDFTTTTANKPSLPLSQKSEVMYSEAIDSERATIEKKHPVQRNSTIDVPKSVMERYDTDMPKFAEKYREAIQKLDIPSISKYKKQFLTYLTNNYLNKLWLQGWVKNWYKYAIEEAIKEITDNIVSLKVKK